MEKSAKRAITVLAIAVAVLVLVVVYALAVKPALNGYATKAYNQGVYDVAKAVAQNGYVQIPVSNNQSIILVQYHAPQAAPVVSALANSSSAITGA